MIVAALLPWHRFQSASVYGGLGPDNHISLHHGAAEVHRGTEKGLATLGGPIVMLAVLASDRRIDKRLRHRWARVLWSIFVNAIAPIPVMVILSLYAGGGHSCIDKVEPLPAQHAWGYLLLASAVLGFMAFFGRKPPETGRATRRQP
jgi:hypothetical protein